MDFGSNKRLRKRLFCILNEGTSRPQIDSLDCSRRGVLLRHHWQLGAHCAVGIIILSLGIIINGIPAASNNTFSLASPEELAQQVPVCN